MRSESTTASVTHAVSEKLKLRLDASPRHPLEQLGVEEIHAARDIIRLQRTEALQVVFRTITLEEPPKAELIPFLAAEHAGELTARTVRPPRLARCLYDVILPDNGVEFCDSAVNLYTEKETSYEIVDKQFHSPMNA